MKMLARLVFLVCSMGFSALGEDLTITSFSGNGTLTWAYPTNGVTNYRVEWASPADGTYTNFDGAAAMLNTIVPTGATMTATLPITDAEVQMFYFYRVVATATNPPAPAGMVLIPGGTNAGTNPLVDGETYGPAYYPATYSLTVPSFYMDKHEVTKALWDEVYAWAITNGYGFDNAGSGKATNHPVHTVNWYDAVKWCNARSQQEGRQPVYTVNGAVYMAGQSNDVVQTSAVGYRLPTDVEWEYAARGGAASRRYPWTDSDEIQHARANYFSTNSFSYDTSPTRRYHPAYSNAPVPYTSPVGSFAANGYGLHDMAGNVWERCFDWYPGFEGTYRVFRGGGFDSRANACRVGLRFYGRPDLAPYYSYGFRTVLPPDQ
ncbi:MAG: formylglycine-generating enzyme family protein [Kiritimatiellia bacterium]